VCEKKRQRERDRETKRDKERQREKEGVEMGKLENRELGVASTEWR